MIKALLQGKPLKHPLHPAVVHLPIALLLFSLILDLIAFAADGDAGRPWVRGATYCLALGVIGALLAAVPGFADYSDIRRDHSARKVATRHMLLNLVAVALFGVALALRYPQRFDAAPPTVPFFLSLVGNAIIGYSGYLGGILVYDDGIGVGRHHRRTRTPDKTIELTWIGPDDAYVPVADEAALEEGATLRAEVNGTVVAVARCEGQVYAFQEFCTHRYGPLSEGAIRDCQVRCPWHGSCFDVRSGKVTEGPAKVDLKTFPARVRDGKIEIQVPSCENDANATPDQN